MSLRCAYVLAGFCSGGAMAYEMARQLADSAHEPAGLILLGVSPYDLPGLVPPGSLGRWMGSMTPGGKLRIAILFAAGLTSAEGRAYVASRVRDRARLAKDLADPNGRER
jgi:hypothetical protein